MGTSKTDLYENLWENAENQYIGNGFLLLVLLTTMKKQFVLHLDTFFHFFIRLPIGQKIVQIHSKKKHCHYLIQRQFGGVKTFVKVIANEETHVLALFDPMERSTVTVHNCQKSC